MNVIKTGSVKGTDMIKNQCPLFLFEGLMGLAAINFFISLTIRTDPPFNEFDKHKGQTFLFTPGPDTNRTINALLRHLFIFFCDFGHRLFSFGLKPVLLFYQQDSEAQTWMDYRLQRITCHISTSFFNFFSCRIRPVSFLSWISPSLSTSPSG